MIQVWSHWIHWGYKISYWCPTPHWFPTNLPFLGWSETGTWTQTREWMELQNYRSVYNFRVSGVRHFEKIISNWVIHKKSKLWSLKVQRFWDSKKECRIWDARDLTGFLRTYWRILGIWSCAAPTNDNYFVIKTIKPIQIRSQIPPKFACGAQNQSDPQVRA